MATYNIALLVVLSAMSVLLVCDFDELPLFDNELPIFTDRFEGFCTSDLVDYTCHVLVYDQNQLVQVNPDTQKIKDVGVIDFFQARGNIVSVYFEPEFNVVRAGIEYNISVSCSDGTNQEVYNASVVPVFRNLDRPVEIGVNVVQSAPLWVGLALALSFLSIFTFFLFKGVGSA